MYTLILLSQFSGIFFLSLSISFPLYYVTPTLSSPPTAPPPSDPATALETPSAPALPCPCPPALPPTLLHPSSFPPFLLPFLLLTK